MNSIPRLLNQHWCSPHHSLGGAHIHCTAAYPTCRLCQCQYIAETSGLAPSSAPAVNNVMAHSRRSLGLHHRSSLRSALMRDTTAAAAAERSNGIVLGHAVGMQDSSGAACCPGSIGATATAVRCGCGVIATSWRRQVTQLDTI